MKKIKFLSKHNLNEFVPKESSLVSWGGKDCYEFNFEPEIKKVEEAKKKVYNLHVLIIYSFKNILLVRLQYSVALINNFIKKN